jgi:hypothetical protein
MQSRIRKYHRAFFYGKGGHAFSYAVKSLRRKLMQLRAGERNNPQQKQEE